MGVCTDSGVSRYLLALMGNENYYNFIDKAKKFACGIYKDFPGALVPKTTDAGYKLIWDDLCAEPPPSDLPGLPPPPKKPFTGGQCPVPYGVYMDVKEINNNVAPPLETLLRVEVGGFWGVSDIGLGTNVTQRFVYISTPHYNGPNNPPAVTRPVITSLNNGLEILSIELRRVDGLPDNCGDPPKQFPPSPLPPGGYQSPPIVIINNDGDESHYIFNLFPPTIQKFPDDPLPPITINVGGDDVDLNFDIDFNFGGGVSFNRPGSSGSGLPSGFEYKFQNLGNGLNGVGEGVSRLEDGFSFENFPPFFQDAPQVEKEEKTIVGNEDEEEEKDGLLGVLVELTTPPTDVQFGTPNVNFAGWFTFLVQGGYAPREPINFDRGYFAAPPGATGYALTFTKGAKGKVTVYSKKD